jgi:hypothetical protein
MSGPGGKKFILAGPWDLEIPTNVIMYERSLSLMPHPHPEVESLRFTYVMKLRQSFQEMCHSREGELFFFSYAYNPSFFKKATTLCPGGIRTHDPLLHSPWC